MYNMPIHVLPFVSHMFMSWALLCPKNFPCDQMHKETCYQPTCAQGYVHGLVSYMQFNNTIRARDGDQAGVRTSLLVAMYNVHVHVHVYTCMQSVLRSLNGVANRDCYCESHKTGAKMIDLNGKCDLTLVRIFIPKNQ